MSRDTRLGVVEPERVLRPCLACGADIPARLVRYVRRSPEGRAVNEGELYEPEPHKGPCGARCESGWPDWKPGRLIHRAHGCVQCKHKGER